MRYIQGRVQPEFTDLSIGYGVPTPAGGAGLLGEDVYFTDPWADPNFYIIRGSGQYDPQNPAANEQATKISVVGNNRVMALTAPPPPSSTNVSAGGISPQYQVPIGTTPVGASNNVVIPIATPVPFNPSQNVIGVTQPVNTTPIGGATQNWQIVSVTPSWQIVAGMRICYETYVERDALSGATRTRTAQVPCPPTTQPLPNTPTPIPAPPAVIVQPPAQPTPIPPTTTFPPVGTPTVPPIQTPPQTPPPTSTPTTPNTPSTPPTVTGIVYTRFDANNDIVTDRTHVQTYGLWSSLSSSLYDFYTGSVQTAAQKQYYYDVYQSASNACDAEIQFSVAYGHRAGSGSIGAGGKSIVSPSKAIYSQTRLLCLDSTDEVFSFTSGSTTVDSDHVYVISFNRTRLNDKIDPGNWQLTLCELNGSVYGNQYYTGSNVRIATASSKTITLIDKSLDSQDTITETGLASPVYSVVSGSIADGVYDENDGTWGLVYPDMGMIVLNADKLNSQLGFNSVTASNINGDNAFKLLTSISGSAATHVSRSIRHPFMARSSKVKTTSYYFASIKPSMYNFSNNPTYVSGSNGQFKYNSFEKDPKTYVTTIGLYNDRYELLAVGKLSQPFQKSFFNQTTIRVKLNY